MRADEARAAGDEYSHSRSISIYSLTTIYSFIFRAKNNFPPPASADAEQRVARRATSGIRLINGCALKTREETSCPRLQRGDVFVHLCSRRCTSGYLLAAPSA